MSTPARRPFWQSGPLEVSPKPKRTLKAHLSCYFWANASDGPSQFPSLYYSFRFVQEYACRAGAVHESTVGDGALSGKESVGVTCRRRPSLPSALCIEERLLPESKLPGCHAFCGALPDSHSHTIAKLINGLWSLDDPCYRKLQRRPSGL